MSRAIAARGRARIAAVAAAGAGLLALAAGAGPVAAAGAAELPATAPAWHVVKAVKTNFDGQFSAVVATGKTTGWAFDGTGEGLKTTAWEENGKTWTKVAFPSTSGEEVMAAEADSPKDVWAFTQNFDNQSSRVLRWNGAKWSVLKTFPDLIGNATVLSGHAVWVYGELPEPGSPALGVWFYNGKTWTHVNKTLSGGSALSNKNVWAYSLTSVAHWNGSKWTSTSVKSLLPAKMELNSPALAGILALSATDVYALGNGNDEDDGGPTVVLHYNGSKWSKVASGNFGTGPGPQFSSDGKDGLWLPMEGGDGATSYLLHYASGNLTKATLPVSAPKITIGAVARVPGSAGQLAVGFTHAANNLGADVVGVVLQYS